VVCLGGLVQMAVQFGKAFGMKLTVFNTSPNKRKDIGFNAYVIIVESS
jgi:D-arabinose 1-dehydrogenase-like Zn-dependent alcohol dehydrogenase